MQTRIMIDGIHADVPEIKRQFPSPQMILVYVTGSADIKWTDADRAEFQGAVQVTVDQGGLGSPVPDAMVRDVEPGGWSAAEAVKMDNWHTPRPTIYCDRTRLQEVMALGWKGDVILAWPGYNSSGPPSFPGVNVVAVQHLFAARWDESIVYDTTWPHVPNQPEPRPTVSLTVSQRIANLAFGVVPGCDHYVVEYAAHGIASNVVLARPPQPKAGTVVHVTEMAIPGGSGGSVTVFAIVHGRAQLVGSVSLP